MGSTAAWAETGAESTEGGSVTATKAQTSEERAERRAKYLSGLVWHAGAFIIINAFFWILDVAVGQSGLQWSFWITATWGFALAFHALAYVVDGRGLEARKTQEYLDEERRREALHR
jgi:hypothetical protein